jgi:hypothetical protein
MSISIGMGRPEVNEFIDSIQLDTIIQHINPVLISMNLPVYYTVIFNF